MQLSQGHRIDGISLHFRVGDGFDELGMSKRERHAFFSEQIA